MKFIKLYFPIMFQAEKTFAIANKDFLKANILILRKLIDEIELADLHIDPYFVSKRSFEQRVKLFFHHFNTIS